MKLPESFIEEVRELLGEEGLEKYLEAMQKPYQQGIRVNTLKACGQEMLEDLQEEMGDTIEDGLVPWCPAGYYIPEKDMALSHSPYYYAGLYYLQEPSAMAPAALLPIEEGDRVLDLCAAPGGKTTALGARLNGTGLLVANDISPSRAQALLKNIELFGLDRAVVTCDAPHKLKKNFKNFFTKILIDAPCSGEGMFRKDITIAKNWLQYGNAYYADLQREILSHAAEMLSPGGMMLYSTCTYSPMEDEQMMDDFLNEHPDFHLVDFPIVGGMMPGHPEWSRSGRTDLAKTAHFWPHLVRGEGHYAALLQRDGELPAQSDLTLEKDPIENGKKNRGSFQNTKTTGNATLSAFTDWVKTEMKSKAETLIPAGSRLDLSADHLYAMLVDRKRLEGIRVLRPGLLLGTIDHGRFEPSAAWAMSLDPEKCAHVMALDREEALHYLKGETLEGSYEDGWNLICVKGAEGSGRAYALGWGKVRSGVCKNKYLKGWRMLK